MAQCAEPSSSNGQVRKERRVAIITGITGQDGSYLAEFLLEKGYEVHGIVRRSSSFNTGRIEHLYKNPQTHTEGNMKLHYGDLTDSTCLVKIINEVKPTEIYNLGAQSHVKISFDLAEYTADVVGVGTLRLLDAVKTCGLTSSVRFYQASTSELFGKVQEIPQTETTPFYPRSPYGAAKLYAYWIVVNFREAYNLFAVNGILFNHESPRRGANFVTRKISRSVAKIHLGQLDCFSLGNLDSKRDWGHAKDYVESWAVVCEGCVFLSRDRKWSMPWAGVLPASISCLPHALRRLAARDNMFCVVWKPKVGSEKTARLSNFFPGSQEMGLLLGGAARWGGALLGGPGARGRGGGQLARSSGRFASLPPQNAAMRRAVLWAPAESCCPAARFCPRHTHNTLL
ncbi:hypothetical protein AAFF_G00032540 [Aldrovandia affinis]|uniref:GDP-mannose 4,6 dehydratase n=1 Tax=Aldrovandia affinis TaxID=143900 RepID=A0AAD7WGA2_9TELE|nr:hypothetical protein AAFF_G00032540 [Aldrovandia affinis]